MGGSSCEVSLLKVDVGVRSELLKSMTQCSNQYLR